MNWSALNNGVLVFFISLIAYLLTLCPTVYGGDSGDFITAAYTLGVPHPTGYPLYTILGKLFTLLPAASIAYRVNMLSAVSAALASMMVCMTVYERVGKTVPSMAAGLALAFTRPLWGEAVVAEVYALNTFFAALVFYFAFRFRKGRGSGDLNMLAFSSGLALTNHLSFALYLPAIACLAHDGRPLREYRRLAYYFLIPLVIYLYIPMSAMRGGYVWHDPTSASGLLDFITAREHRMVHTTSDIGAGISRSIEGLKGIVLGLGFMALLAIIGAYTLRGDKEILLSTLLLVAVELVYMGFLHNVSMELVTFGLPVTALLAVYSGLGFSYLMDKSDELLNAGFFTAMVLAAILASSAYGNYHVSDRSENRIAYYYGLNILNNLQPDALLLMENDNNIFILNYLQKAEGVRPDVLLVDRVCVLNDEFYGEDVKKLGEAGFYERRSSVEYDAVKSGRPVYYTNRVSDLPEKVFLLQEGLVYRAYQEGDVPLKYRWGDYGLESSLGDFHLDYFTREILSTYYLRKADSLHAEGKLNGAMSYYRRASDAAGNIMQARYNIALSYIQNRMYSRAVGELNKAIIIEEDAGALGNQCFVLIQLGDFYTARRNCERALELNPGDSVAEANLEYIRYIERQTLQVT
ncbi:MAG: DUF2723 domain-containing protein [Candidatus Altiarchaeota archaeon]